MSKKSNMFGRKFVRTIYELVLYKYEMPEGLTCLGEAELTIEEFLERNANSGTCSQLRFIRVDILSVYAPDGTDLFLFACEDKDLKSALEEAAVTHYLYPPAEAVSLPRRLSEW